MAYFKGMTRTKAIVLTVLLLGIVCTSLVLAEHVSTTATGNVSEPEAVTLALRSTGHELLLGDGDETTRVLPVFKSKEDWYEVSFENELSIEPDNLVEVLNLSLQNAGIPTNYWAEVKIAGSDSVVYSYLMDGDENASIIPCFGRALPTDEYTVNVKFTSAKSNASAFILIVALVVISLLLYFFKIFEAPVFKDASLTLGNYLLKKDERKLVYRDSDMNLTEKEVEILELLSGRPNQTISREELQREVWESKGVVVSRSLDTYISKLRRKFDKDNSVSIVNIHGAGYKLEVRK